MAIGQTGLTPQILRPKAAPTDIFVRTNEGAQLAQLAEGLSQFAPSLARFGGVLEDRKNARDKIEGENTARELAESGKTYRQAIEQGLISPHQSPWFRVGAYETFGRTSAYKYDADLKVALAQSEVAESTNPADFDAFEGQFRSKWSAEHLGEKTDPYFSNAFGTQADNLVNGQRANFAESAGTRLVKQTGEAFHAEVFSIASQKLSTDDRVAAVNLALSRQIATGMNKSIANQLVASAVTQAAKRMNDVGVLDVLDKIKLGTGTLAGTAYGSQAREQAENEIASVNQSRHAAEEADAVRAKNRATDAVVADVVALFQQAPDARTVNIAPFVERMRQVNPEKADTLLRMQDAWTDHNYSGDPVQTSHLFMGVFAGSTGMSQLNSALVNRQVSKQDYVEMANIIRRRDKEDNKVTKLFNDDGFKEGKDRLQKLFVAQFGAIEKPGNSQRYENAIAEFTANYFRWKEGEGAGVTDPLKVNEFLTRTISGKILKFGDGSQKTDRDAIPPANIGPTATDWNTQPVADQQTIIAAEQEWAQLLTKRITRLSPSTLSLLISSGVDLKNPNEIKQFFKKQQELGPQYVVPETAP